MTVPGAFFEVTGAFAELVKIEQGIEKHSGRETASSSMTLDLWLEMRDEWHTIHRAEVEKRAQDAIKIMEQFNESIRIIAEAWSSAMDSMAAMYQEAQATPKADSWETKQTHPDCADCEAAVEEAILSYQEGRFIREDGWSLYRIIQPDAEHIGQVRKAS